MKNNIIIGVIIALVIGTVAGFLGGMTYQKNQKTTSNQNVNFQGRNGGPGQGGGRGAGANGGGVMGEIISSDDSSITVKLSDGSSKIVLLNDKTAINKSSEGSKSDLKTGEKIAAFGTTNSDGSVTAVNVQLNPQTRMFQRPTGTPAKAE